MTAETAQFTLEIQPRGEWKGELYPEQSPDFDLRLRNNGSETIEALPLYGSFQTPRVVALDATGKTIGTYTKADMYARQVGDPMRHRNGPPQLQAMAPGRGSSISIDVWTYRAPLPPGRYAVFVQHRTTPGGPFIESNRYTFEIVKANVMSAALGYDGATRVSSVLAWLDAAHSDGNGPERLLVRLSASKGHSSLMMGANSQGEFPRGSLAAVGQVVVGGTETPLNWAAVLSGKEATAIRHNMTKLRWRSEPVVLSIDGATPVPRFPTMEDQALFLATGAHSSGAALAGALFEDRRGLVQQWSVPLEEKPALSACLARTKRPVSLLLLTNDANGSRISRLDVTIDGKIIGGQKVVRRSENIVLAIAPAFNPESGNAFFALEAGTEKLEQVALVTIPMSGPVRAPKLQPIPGWPTDENGAPVKPLQTQIEEATDGSVAIVFVDSRGFFYAGKLAPKAFVGRLRAKPESPCSFPHVGALARNAMAGCFTSEGMLFTPGSETEA